MRRHLSLTALVLLVALAAIPAPAEAGVRATLILTSGERVGGMLVDMGGRDFTMVRDGDEIRIRIGDVAVIDFVGGGQGIPATETSKMQSGRALVFQRGGDYFYGRLYDIAGDNPLVFTFNTPDGRVEINSGDIGRVFLQRWDGMPAGQAAQDPVVTNTPPQADQEGVAIPANRGWVNTGIQVQSGQMVAFSTTGEVVLSADDSDTAGPAGAHNGREAFRGAPLPGVAAGALVAKVGVGPTFAIGDQTQPLRMPSGGVLFLAVNDDRPGDNRGEFRVRISIR